MHKRVWPFPFSYTRSYDKINKTDERETQTHWERERVRETDRQGSVDVMNSRGESRIYLTQAILHTGETLNTGTYTHTYIHTYTHTYDCLQMMLLLSISSYLPCVYPLFTVRPSLFAPVPRVYSLKGFVYRPKGRLVREGCWPEGGKGRNVWEGKKGGGMEFREIKREVFVE